MVSEKLKLICMGDESLNDKSIKNFLMSLGFQELNVDANMYETFTLLVNPYQKVLNFYMNVVLSSLTPIFKDKINDYIIFFREWISKMFYSKKLVVKLRFDGTDEKYTKILSSFRTNINYNIFMVKDYTFTSDIRKIVNDVNFDFEQIIYKWKMNEFYDYETAKIIFQFYKNEFFMGQYNPFSFSYNNLTSDKKIDFIHKPF